MAHSKESNELIETLPEEEQALDLLDKYIDANAQNMLKKLTETMEKEQKKTILTL